MSGDLIVKGIGALLLIGLMAIEAFPCRPLRTEDCGTTPHGRPALELSIEAGMERNDADCMLCSVFNYGLSHNWDAGIEIPGYSFLKCATVSPTHFEPRLISIASINLLASLIASLTAG